MFKTKGCEVNGFLNNDVQENCTIGKIIERLSIVQSWSADVLSGRRFVMTAVRRFARTALDVLSGRTCLRRFVRKTFCQDRLRRFVRTAFEIFQDILLIAPFCFFLLFFTHFASFCSF